MVSIALGCILAVVFCNLKSDVVFCNDTCQCIAAVLVFVVAQTSVDCISLFERGGVLESSSHVF